MAVPDGLALNPHAQLFVGITELGALREGSEGARFGTTRQAVDLGYRVTILRDACASFSPELHQFALGVRANLATISTVEEFVAALTAEQAGREPG